MPNEIFKVFKTKKYGQVTPPTYHNYAPQNMKDRLLVSKVDDILGTSLPSIPGFFFSGFWCGTGKIPTATTFTRVKEGVASRISPRTLMARMPTEVHIVFVGPAILSKITKSYILSNLSPFKITLGLK